LSTVYGIITDLVMSGGWRFEQPLRSGQIVNIEGGSYHDLENRVLEFRLRQIDLVPPGTSTREQVQSDLREYICAKSPNNCRKPVGPNAPLASPSTSHYSFINPFTRVSDWFSNLAYRSLEFVDAAESNRRSNVCVHCPHNTEWRTPCSPCNDAVGKEAFKAQAGKRVQNENHLRFCRIFGHYLPTAVWLKDTFSVAQHEKPSFCWKTS
jgi:hypothetical protein